MMKKLKLTLIELLISMAIFTVMISLLIKAFQLASDTQSRLEAQSRAYDYGRLVLNLFETDLRDMKLYEHKSFRLRTAPSTYEVFDRSLLAYISSQSLNDLSSASETNLICFFKKSAERDGAGLGLVSTDLIQYAITSKGLVRRERRLTAAEINSTFNGFESQNIDTHFESLADDLSSVVVPAEFLKTVSIHFGGVIEGSNGNEFKLLRDESENNFVVKEFDQIRFQLSILDNQNDNNTIRDFSRTIAFQKTGVQ